MKTVSKVRLYTSAELERASATLTGLIFAGLLVIGTVVLITALTWDTNWSVNNYATSVVVGLPSAALTWRAWKVFGFVHDERMRRRPTSPE